MPSFKIKCFEGGGGEGGGLVFVWVLDSGSCCRICPQECVSVERFKENVWPPPPPPPPQVPPEAPFSYRL